MPPRVSEGSHGSRMQFVSVDNFPFQRFQTTLHIFFAVLDFRGITASELDDVFERLGRVSGFLKLPLTHQEAAADERKSDPRTVIERILRVGEIPIQEVHR